MSNAPKQRRIRLSSATHAGYTNSPVGWIGALSLHVFIVAATFFTWAHRLDIADESPPVVPVELVTLGAKTNIAPMVTEKPKEEPKQIETPPPAPPTPPAPARQEVVEPAPQPAPTPPKEKVKPAQEKKKSAEDVFAALLDKAAKPEKAPANAKVGSRTIKGFGAQNAMTMDLVDSLRNQIAQCWSPPAAAPHPEQLIVTVQLFLNPDGSVAQPPQLTAESKADVAGNPFMRAAADAALRAVNVCAPYKLPGDRYAQWRDIEVVFDPRQMAGLQ